MTDAACPETPSYLALAARLNARGLGDWDGVSWIFGAVRDVTGRDASLVALTPEEWRQLWARAGEARAEDVKQQAPRERKAIEWQV